MRHGADVGVVCPGGPFDHAGRKARSDVFRELLGQGGADVICDTVAGDHTEPARRAIGWGAP